MKIIPGTICIQSLVKVENGQEIINICGECFDYIASPELRQWQQQQRRIQNRPARHHHHRQSGLEFAPFSLANGWDLGVFSRANPAFSNLTIVEKMSLTLTRLYVQAIKLKSNGLREFNPGIDWHNMNIAFTGHAISFAQNAAESTVNAVLPLFAEFEALQRSLEIVFVGPRRYHPLMRAAGLHVPGLQVRPEIVMAALESLMDSNPYYAHVRSQMRLNQEEQRQQHLFIFCRIFEDIIVYVQL
jgi:hypothetical protein